MSEERVDVAAHHRQVAATFSRKVAGVHDWDAPTPVREWVARDVVAHLVEWSRGLFGSAQGVRFGEIGDVRADPVAGWRAHTEQMQALLDNPALDDVLLTNTYFGQQPLVEAIDSFYVPDVFLHTWDLAMASGQEPGLDQATCASMLAGMEKVEGQIRSGGQFGTRQPVREGASSEQRLMAFIGRDPYWTPRPR